MLTIKKYLPRFRQTLAVTVVACASFHLLIALVTSIVMRTVDYINPLDFLGLAMMLPHGYVHSTTVTVIAWGVLIAIFSAVWYLHGKVEISLIVNRRIKNLGSVNGDETK